MDKFELIDKLIPQVIESLTQDDLIAFAKKTLDSDYQNDHDLLVEDAITFGLIKDEDEIK